MVTTRDQGRKNYPFISNIIVTKLNWEIGHAFDFDNCPSILNKFILECVRYKVHQAIIVSKKCNRRYIKIKYHNEIMEKIRLNHNFRKSLKKIKIKL